MSDYRCLVSVAVDLSRLSNTNTFAKIQLRRLLQVGREIDLLESIRRSQKKEELTIESILIHASHLGIDASTVESYMLPIFQKHRMLDIDEKKVILNYTETIRIYQYGKIRLDEEVIENELKFSNLLCKTTREGVPIEELDKVLELFPAAYRSGLRRFLFENNILSSFMHKGMEFITSPRIFKTDVLDDAKEILTDHKFGNLIDFIDQNPGNPLPVVGQHIKTDENVIKVLSKCGVIDPVRLDVNGDVKDYLFSSNIMNKRDDKDHFDLVRKTLANFRFGEYYSERTKLRDLDRFFEYMIEHGYAGRAEAIGTDYMSLEWAGVFRIEKITGSNEYRFWMLKKDVIEDARSVLHGFVPISSSLEKIDLSNIESVVQTRSNLEVRIDSNSQKELINALRQIQEGLAPS